MVVIKHTDFEASALVFKQEKYGRKINFHDPKLPLNVMFPWATANKYSVPDDKFYPELRDRGFLNYPISAGDFSDFLHSIDERLGSPEFRKEMGMPAGLNYMKLAGMGKTKLKVKLPLDDDGSITARLYRSTVEGRDELPGAVHLDALGELLRGQMLRVIVRVKRLWVSTIAYGLQFELAKMEFEKVAASTTLGGDDDDDLDFVD